MGVIEVLTLGLLICAVIKETLIKSFLPFFKMSSKTQTRTFFKTAKRLLRINQRILNLMQNSNNKKK